MDLLREWWVFILGAATGLMWLMRLEARSLRNESDIRRMIIQRKEDLENAQRARDEANDTLKEIRADVKALLSRGPRE